MKNMTQKQLKIYNTILTSKTYTINNIIEEPTKKQVNIFWRYYSKWIENEYQGLFRTIKINDRDFAIGIIFITTNIIDENHNYREDIFYYTPRKNKFLKIFSPMKLTRFTLKGWTEDFL